MEQGLMLALLLVTANLDTLLLAAVWHSDGRRITWQEAGILTLTTSLMTGLALLLGQCGSGLWSVTAAKRISALLLVGMGLWMLLDWLRQLGEWDWRRDWQASPLSGQCWATPSSRWLPWPWAAVSPAGGWARYWETGRCQSPERCSL